MLVIRNEQFDALGKAKEKAYYRTLLEKLQNSHLNDESLDSDESGIKRVMQVVERSEKYGISSVDQLDVYFNLVIRYGLDFDLNDELADIKAILNNKNKHGSEKIIDIELLLLSKDH